MIRIYLLFFPLLLHGFAIKGQQNSIDSLLRVFESTPVKEERVDILNELSAVYYDRQTEKAYNTATEAYTQAAAASYNHGMAQALILQGYYFALKGSFDEALRLYKRAFKIPVSKVELSGYNLILQGNVLRALAQYDSASIMYKRSIALLIPANSPGKLAFAYKNLGRLYVLQWKNKEAREIFEKAFEIYEQLNHKFGLADTWFSLAEVSQNEANFPEASDYIQRACAITQSSNDVFLELRCAISQGDIEFRVGNYALALENLFKALKYLDTTDIPHTMAEVYSSIGDVYEALGQNDVALRYYIESLKLAERIGIKHEIAKVYSNLAWIYRNQRDFNLAHDYIKRSFNIRKQIGDEHGISNCYNVSGLIFMEEEKYDTALAALEHSLEIRKRIGHREGVSACLFNLALIFEKQEQYDKALQYQLDALAIDEAIGNKFSIGISCNSLGSIYTRLKEFKRAAAFLKRAEKLAAETGSKSLLMNNHYYWSEYFEARNDTKTALAYYKKYSDVNDSIYYDVSAHKIAELQALYQIEKKDREIELLSREKLFHENEIQLQRAQIRFQRSVIISVISGLVLVSLLASIIYIYTRRLRKAHRQIVEQKEEIQAQSEELIEANQTIAEINKKLEGKIEERTLALSQAYKELDTFFYRSSHDFRRPLTTFLGLAEVAKVTVKDANALELFQKVRETAYNLDKMLVKLQSISDVGSQQLIYKEVMIKEIFDTVCDTFRDEIHQKNIQTSVEIRLKDKFISYPAMVKIIIENLVENAIHFSGIEKPFIKLKAMQTASYVVIDVQDNGQGIPVEYQYHIFDMYFRANERSKGNGLGLYIVKKAVEKLDGSISLSSIPLAGSTFTVMLPIGGQVLAPSTAII